MKLKTVYFCQNCGVQSPKWLGKCPSCNEWNTYVEEVVQKNEPSASTAISKTSYHKKTNELIVHAYTILLFFGIGIALFFFAWR
jgi:predicted ATP-dependent serine protease